MIQIYFFTHGTTTDNEKKIASGWSNPGLSELGINRVKELKKITDKYDFDMVFCSDLDRAEQTAKILFGDNSKIIKDKRLRECNYGVMEGKSTGLLSFGEHIDIPFKGGESLIDVENRVRDFLSELGNYYKIAIIGHRATQLALEVILNKLSWSQAIKSDWRISGSWQPGWIYNKNKEL